jgi:serine/threonine protein kinase
MAVYGNRWEVIRNLSEGGQGLTLLVRDSSGQEHSECVLKRLKNVQNAMRLGRFKTEVATLQSLQHANLLRYIDADLDVEKPWVVTEYCAGGDLARALRFWQSNPTAALGLFLEICDGMAEAHRRGIVHRDLKPANVFLRHPHAGAAVGDFGLAFIEGSDTRHTEVGEVVGPWFFMAPEMEDGRVEQITPRTDVYSLGKLLYWLLAGTIFNREKHREHAWNLVDRTGNPRFELVNRLLEGMLVAGPGSRLIANAEEVAAATRGVARAFTGPYNVVTPNYPQPCLYCGFGVYRFAANSNSIYNLLGTQPVGTSNWRVLSCDQCGHLQLFRIDLGSRRKDWWEDQS